MRILTRKCRLFYLSFNGHGAKATFQFCGHDNVSWDDYSQFMEKWNSCSKPPIRCPMLSDVFSEPPVVVRASQHWQTLGRYEAPHEGGGRNWVALKHKNSIKKL